MRKVWILVKDAEDGNNLNGGGDFSKYREKGYSHGWCLDFWWLGKMIESEAGGGETKDIMLGIQKKQWCLFGPPRRNQNGFLIFPSFDIEVLGFFHSSWLLCIFHFVMSNGTWDDTIEFTQQFNMLIQSIISLSGIWYIFWPHCKNLGVISSTWKTSQISSFDASHMLSKMIT